MGAILTTPLSRRDPLAMTLSTPKQLTAASVLTLAALAASTGCQSSGGGSRWAWNPFSRSGGDEELVAESAPKLPTDGVTPEIEGLPEAAKSAPPQAATLAQGETPPAVSGIAPTIEAVASVVPTIDKPAPTPNTNPSSWSPYPSSPSANPQAAAPAATPAPTAVAANAGGPYDPNGYKPQSTAAPSTPGGDRYGLGNRYASSTPAAPESAAPFGDLPSTPAAPTTMGDRYASASPAPTTPPAAATPSMPSTPPAGRYGQPAGTPIASAPVTPPSAPAAAEAITPPPAAASPYPSTGIANASPAPATTPAYAVANAQAAPAAAPGYPVAGATPTSPASVGTLPPETSVYASTPITPVEPATATTPVEGAQGGSVVRLTTLPGEYRPGGTSRYPTTGATAPAPTSRY